MHCDISWRSSARSGSTTTIAFNYIGASDALSSEAHTGATNTTKKYSYDALGQRLTLSDGSNRYSYLYDPHGSVSLLIDQASTVKASYGYTGYGQANGSLTKLATGFSANVNAYRYTGKRFDTGSNSYDMGARRYSPATGRFLQQDIYHGALANLGLANDPLTQNRYLFTGANPINFIESDGHQPQRMCPDGDCSLLPTKRLAAIPLPPLDGYREHPVPLSPQAPWSQDTPGDSSSSSSSDVPGGTGSGGGKGPHASRRHTSRRHTTASGTPPPLPPTLAILTPEQALEYIYRNPRILWDYSADDVYEMISDLVDRAPRSSRWRTEVVRTDRGFQYEFRKYVGRGKRKHVERLMIIEEARPGEVHRSNIKGRGNVSGTYMRVGSGTGPGVQRVQLEGSMGRGLGGTPRGFGGAGNPKVR